mgnify:CR=1 FL=1
MNEDCRRLIQDCYQDITKIETLILHDQMATENRFLIDYSIIRACSTIEKCFKITIYEYLSKRVKLDTRAYLSKQLIDSSANPRVGIMESILSDINGNKCNIFKDKIQTHISDDRNHVSDNIKSDLNSLVTLRNDVAHCNLTSRTQSIGTIIKYYKSGVKVLRYLEDTLYRR